MNRSIARTRPKFLETWQWGADKTPEGQFFFVAPESMREVLEYIAFWEADKEPMNQSVAGEESTEKIVIKCADCGHHREFHEPIACRSCDCQEFKERKSCANTAVKSGTCATSAEDVQTAETASAMSTTETTQAKTNTTESPEPIPEERAGREATPLHELKIWPSFFCAVKEGRKTYEIRKNERGFMVGDSIRLNEYDLSHGYTGQSIDVKVTYLTEGGQWGLPDDICVMGIRLAAQPSVQAPCCGCSCITCRDKTDVHCWACAHT